jgi:NosR/NirI family nitrous oxide reductase transcriptional regulator
LAWPHSNEVRTLHGLSARPQRKIFGPALGLRIYRALILLSILALVQQQAQWVEAQRPSSLSLRRARAFFPHAHRLQLRDPERGLHFVLDARGETIGCLLTTSPYTDDRIGYSGPNNLLIALNAEGQIAAIEWLQSGDTPEHVATVKAASGFWERLRAWQPNKPDRLPSPDAPANLEAPPVPPVSGATLTSFAIVEAVQQRLSGAAPSLRFPDPLTLPEVTTLFTNATQFVREKNRWRVSNAQGTLLGYILKTSPQTDNVSGYRGPTECLVALQPDGRTVFDVRVRRSYDTDSYVDQIQRDRSFLSSFRGRTIEELANLDSQRLRVEGVSGATQTSYGIAEGIKRRAGAERLARTPPAHWRPALRDWVLAGVVAGALLLAFTSGRGLVWLRWTWRLTLIVYVGLISHDLLSLSLLHGWAVHGPALRSAPGLVLLVGAALLIPWASRRQLYCHHLCPHGAAQFLLGKLSPRQWILPAGSRGTRLLEKLPVMLLALGLVMALTPSAARHLSRLEPFDAWAWRTAGTIPIAIAVLGLIASIFVPQAYCRFGCPTGALLNFIRSAGSADRWSRRDGVALAFVGLGVVAILTVRHWPRSEPAPEPTQWSGRAMGMAWNVKTFDEVADPVAIGQTISNELAWVEAMISHWRPNTDLSAFNAARHTNALPVPWPVVSLARITREMSEITGGALDVTVGPLVKLWGFGPGPRPTNSWSGPSEAALSTTREQVGWQKLEILDGLLRKREPHVQIDLSCVAEGWALDHLTRLLHRRGYSNLLVEFGGELKASGRWPILIEHPNRASVLEDEAIATAGTYRERHAAGPRTVSHLIDGRTGRPVSHQTVSVSVRHPDATRADGWATALNVLGVDEGMPLAERLGLAAQFVVETGSSFRLHSTSAWRAREAATAAPKSTQSPL